VGFLRWVLTIVVMLIAGTFLEEWLLSNRDLRETNEHDVVFDTLTWTSNWVKQYEY
jgi:hypothetical protein